MGPLRRKYNDLRKKLNALQIARELGVDVHEARNKVFHELNELAPEVEQARLQNIESRNMYQAAQRLMENGYDVPDYDAISIKAMEASDIWRMI